MSFFLKLIRRGLLVGALGVATLAILALFGFAVPALDLFNHGQVLLLAGGGVGLIIVAMLLRGRRRGAALVYVLVGIAASASVLLPDMIAAQQARPPAPESGSIVLMTHNVFGLNDRMERVTSAIFAEDPDIVVIQEYFGGQASGLHPALLARYPYFVRCRGGKRANLGLYSRLPFEQEDAEACPDDAYGRTRTAHILARFQTEDGKSFSVLTTHMDWPLPIWRQHEQLAALSELVHAVDGPLIVAGDFNSTPWSYALRGFVAQSGLVRQTLNLFTFPTTWFYFGTWRDTIPFLPLDHVLTRGLDVHEVHTGPATGSDHLPVVMRFSLG